MVHPKVVFFGSGSFSVKPFRRLLESGLVDVVCIVTKPPKKAGRGRRLVKNPLHAEVEGKSIPVIFPKELGGKTAEFLKKFSPDLFVVVSFGGILKKELLSTPRLGSVNLHPSLLPELRGPSPINRAILLGLDKTGVTTILMDEGIDTGPILLQKEVKIENGWDSLVLHDVLSDLGSELLLETIKGLVEGKVKPRPQTGKSSYAPPLRKEEGVLDWDSPVKLLERKVRGLKPWPMAYTGLKGRRIIITEAKGIEGIHEGRVPGEVTGVGDEIRVQAEDGILSILRLKPEGKREMSAKEFSAGRNVRVGDIFEFKE